MCQISLSFLTVFYLTLLSVCFTGYEGVPEFFTDLLNHITSVLQGQISSDHLPLPLASPSSAVLSAPVSEERSGAPSHECCSLLKEDSENNSSSSTWILEGDEGLKSPCQRLGCNSAVSPNFQQHCVATIATKASSQWPTSFLLLSVKTEWMIITIINNCNRLY